MTIQDWFRMGYSNAFRWPDEAFGTAAFGRNAGVFPSVNIDDNGEAYRVTAELPGLQKESLDVTVKGTELTIRGERHVAPPGPEANYHRQERDSGRFRRIVSLPDQVDGERIEARYVNGVLEVMCPRTPAAKERKIQIH